MKSSKELFISNLRRIRKEKFPSQARFAAKIRMSVRGYQKYEQGESTADLDIIDAFAKALECSVSDLVGGESSTIAKPNSKSDLILSIQSKLISLNDKQLGSVSDFIDDTIRFGPTDVADKNAI